MRFVGSPFRLRLRGNRLIVMKLCHALRIHSRCTWRHERAGGTSTLPPSAARSARRAPAGASRQASTPAPAGCTAPGTPPRPGTPPVGAHEEEKRPQRRPVPREARGPTWLSSVNLPDHGLATRETRWQLMRGQVTSGIVRGAYRRCHDTHALRTPTGWLGGSDPPLRRAELWQPRQHATCRLAESAPPGRPARAGQDAPGVHAGGPAGAAAPCPDPISGSCARWGFTAAIPRCSPRRRPARRICCGWP